MNSVFNTRCYYALEICRNSFFIVPVLYLYVMDKGVGLADYMLMQSCSVGIALLFEAPSGYVADVWSRKRALVVGVFAGFFSIFGVYYFDDFWLILASFCTMGVALSFLSGADLALLYDSLKEDGREGDYKGIASKGHSIGLVSMAVCALGSGYLMDWHVDAPILITLAVFGVGIVPALLFKEPLVFIIHRDERENPFVALWRAFKFTLHGHKEVKWIVMFSGVLLSSTMLAQWMKQPYFTEIGLPTYMFGVLEFVAFSCGALASASVLYIEKLFGFKGAYRLMITLIAVLFGGLWLFDGVWSAIFVLIGSVVYGFAPSIISDAINKRTASDVRATVLSIAGMPRRLIVIATVPLWGSLMESTSVSYTSGWVLLLLVCALVIAYNKLRAYRVI